MVADTLPIPFKMKFPDAGIMGTVITDKDCANSIAMLIHTGAGEAGDGNGNVRLQKLANARCHEACNRPGHRTVPVQHFPADPQDLLFHLVGITDNAPSVGHRAAWDRSQCSTNAAASTAFRCCQGLAPKGFYNLTGKAHHHTSHRFFLRFPMLAGSAPPGPVSAPHGSAVQCWVLSWGA